jgi:4-amino-4-deoxy-L-arabinose transferase-like glycosyltransferase
LLGDAYFYHHAANLLADGHGFIVPLDKLEGGQINQAADHPPLFVLYLAAWSLVGLDTATAHMVAGALLGSAAVVLVGLVGRRVAGSTVGVVAAGIAAIYPNLWGWDAMVLSEPAAVVAICLVLLAAWRLHESPSVPAAVVLGTAIGVAGLARAELLFLGPLIAVPLVWRQRARTPAHRLRLIAASGLAAVIVITPWTLYNLSRFEEPVYLSSGFEVTLAYSNCDSVFHGPLVGYWDFGCAPDWLERSGVDTAGFDQSQRSKVWRSEVRHYISDNLDRVPAVVLARVGRVAGVYHPLQQVRLDVVPEGRDVWVARTGMASYYVLVALSAIGWMALGRQGRLRFPLLMPVVVVGLAAAVTFGATRYRAAAEPVFCILAAVGCVVIARALARVRQPPAEHDLNEPEDAAAARGLATPTR